jgi:hypothetical protein
MASAPRSAGDKREGSMNLEELFIIWTHSYHVTAAANLVSIRQSRVLWPTHTLLKRAKRHYFLRRRRSRDILLRIEGQQILIRNQAPLDPGSLDLGATGTLEKYVAWLNSYVYFWPGTALGPREDGMRMFERTTGTRSIVIRVPTRSLIAANRASPACVATCNTGVAWTEQGIRSRRGPEVFQPIAKFSEQPASIHEICFGGDVRLPESAEYGTNPTGPWHTFSQPSTN